MAIPGLLSIIMSLTCFVSLTMSLEGGAQEPTVITAALTELAMTETKEPWFRVTLDSNIKTESAIAVASVYSSSTWTIPIPRLETNLANSVVVYNHSLPMFPCRNEYVHPQFIHLLSYRGTPSLILKSRSLTSSGNITAGIGYYCLCRNGMRKKFLKKKEEEKRESADMQPID